MRRESVGSPPVRIGEYDVRCAEGPACHMGVQVSVRGEDAPGERVIKPASVGIECERSCTEATR